MTIDFSPVDEGQQKLKEFGAQFTREDLIRIANESVDTLLEILDGLTDADVVFDPIDEDANDPYAAEGEEKIGWSLAHLVAHVTSSTEEWVTYSSILARGIPYGAEPRLRYETPWRDITTHAGCIQRLEESRRQRVAYLNAWPDTPDLTLNRELSARFIERFGDFNATACFLFGLKHEIGHYAQFREARRQALAAREANKA